MNGSRPWSENDVFPVITVGVEGHLAAAVEGNKPVRMGNDSARTSGYLGTGQNFVNDTGGKTDVEFTAEMRRGSELFAHLPRLDFVKCDIEGYELIVMRGERRRARCR